MGTQLGGLSSLKTVTLLSKDVTLGILYFVSIGAKQELKKHSKAKGQELTNAATEQSLLLRVEQLTRKELDVVQHYPAMSISDIIDPSRTLTAKLLSIVGSQITLPKRS